MPPCEEAVMFLRTYTLTEHVKYNAESQSFPTTVNRYKGSLDKSSHKVV